MPLTERLFRNSRLKAHMAGAGAVQLPAAGLRDPVGWRAIDGVLTDGGCWT
jgi:hypothetical protein